LDFIGLPGNSLDEDGWAFLARAKVKKRERRYMINENALWRRHTESA
jgi:hypothetical protein